MGYMSKKSKEIKPKLKRKSASGTLHERLTDEEISLHYGEEGLLEAQDKAQAPHDSRRHIRRREKNEKHKERDQKRRNDL